jgi:hypothetical protein
VKIKLIKCVLSEQKLKEVPVLKLVWNKQEKTSQSGSKKDDLTFEFSDEIQFDYEDGTDLNL